MKTILNILIVLSITFSSINISAETNCVFRCYAKSEKCKKDCGEDDANCKMDCWQEELACKKDCE